MALAEYYKTSNSGLMKRIQQLNRIFLEKNQINIQEREKFKSACYLGFANIGNTCFINAIMISIIHSKPIVDSLMDTKTYYNSIITENEFNLFNLLVSLFYVYYNENTNQFMLNESMFLFVNAFFSTFRNHFQLNVQEDANYFLTTILNLIDDVFGEIDTITTFRSNNDYGLQKGLFIDKHFNLNTVNEFKCLIKNHKSISNESQMMLVLDIINCSNLEEAIDLYFQTVQLNDKENLFFCLHCNNYVLAEKSIRISSYPNLLIIYIKRFDTNVS